jgi:SAM-dependent methyltransferase
MQKIWEDHYKAHNYFHLEPHEFLPAIVQKSDQLGFTKLLDLGCGPGQNLLFMAEKGFSVTGVDFSPAAATNAEDLLQSKKLEGKVYLDNLFDRVTAFDNEQFEVILAINSLQYTDIETFKNTIRDIADLLVEKGLFLLVISSKESPINVEVPEQLFFQYEEITPLLSKHFDILDFTKDYDNDLTFMLQKKNGHNQ